MEPVSDDDQAQFERDLADYERELRWWQSQADIRLRYGGSMTPYGRLGPLGPRPRPPEPPAHYAAGRFVKPVGAGRKVRNAGELRAAFCDWRRAPGSGRKQSDFAEW